MQPRNMGIALWFAAVTLISAFLVFQVQPVISKIVLPWFGGSPAVWTTCMLFFQVVLFAGYAYAHLLNSLFRPRWQGIIHFVLLIATLCTLPITPDDSWKPQGDENPTWQILLILSANVGLPYFLLSSTGPLLQAWFSRACAGQSPYRLYALSNIGSLFALITYPFIFEPALTTTLQGALWSLGFCVFALLCGYLAANLGRLAGSGHLEPATTASPEMSEQDAAPSLGRKLCWLLLPATASVMLLATTSHVCQDVAVIPFLWVAPLAIYLLTFIISFDREKWYSRRWFTALTVISILAISLAFSWRKVLPLVPEVLLYFAAMFLGCMVCHGELVRSKPKPRYLTTFYMMSSAGGALGGIFVALICPLIFRTYFEMNLCLIVNVSLAMALLCYELRDSFLVRPQRKFVAALAFFAVFVFVGAVQTDQAKGNPVLAQRNFYGALTVDLAKTNEGVGLSLLHGRIIHGFQFADSARLRFPTTYYSRESGVGLTLKHLRNDQPMRVGAVGLGVGTVSAYGQSGDYFRFYEINPAMVRIARETFGFLSTCPATVEIALGDARLSLEREPPQNFDVLVLDAFSGDSIPAHLLTAEAFQVYRRHLKPDGIIAVHISNRHLRLEPVVLRQAEHAGMKCVRVINRGESRQAVMLSKWMLVTNNERFLSQPEVVAVSGKYSKRPGSSFPLWTDQYNNLFQIVNIF
jgi:SAM-dependent methyltransferase